MTSDIRAIKTAPSQKDPIRKRPDHPEQEFESLLRKRTEMYRDEKVDPSGRQPAKKDNRDDLRGDLSLIEGNDEGKSGVTREDGQEEEDLSMSGYLLHEAYREKETTKTDLPSMDAPVAGSSLIPEGQGKTSQPLEAGLIDPSQRMKDDAVMAIPVITEDMLQRIEDPAETVKMPRIEETGRVGASEPELTPSFLNRLQEVSQESESLKMDGVEKHRIKTGGLEPEGLSRMEEGLKVLKDGAAIQDPLDTIKSRLGTMTAEKSREESLEAEQEKDAGLEGLKELSQTVKTGEFRTVQNVQKVPDQGTVDRNLEMAATEIVHRVETLEDGDRTTIRVRLYPEEIGEMEITLSMEEGKLSGKILVENKEMRQVFTERLGELNQTLKACHIDVAKFEVGIGAGQHQDQAKQQNQRQAAYPLRSVGYKNEPSGMEERKLPGKTAARGIDLLA